MKIKDVDKVNTCHFSDIVVGEVFKYILFDDIHVYMRTECTWDESKSNAVELHEGFLTHFDDITQVIKCNAELQIFK